MSSFPVCTEKSFRPGGRSECGSMSDSGAQPLTGAIIDWLVAGDIYINLHSGAYIGGEIWGQAYPDPDALTSVSETYRATPAAFRLDQDYPDPFNPSPMIRFQKNSVTSVDITVYDALGQKVVTLLHGMRQPGEYILKFTPPGLLSSLGFHAPDTWNGNSVVHRFKHDRQQIAPRW